MCPKHLGGGWGGGGGSIRQTVASQSKQFCCCGIMFCMCRMVLFTAFYALFSPDSLFWVSLFQILTDQATPVSTQSKIKYYIKLSKQAKSRQNS